MAPDIPTMEECMAKLSSMVEFAENSPIRVNGAIFFFMNTKYLAFLLHAQTVRRGIIGS